MKTMKKYFFRILRTTFLMFISPTMLLLELCYNLVGRSLMEEKLYIDIDVKEKTEYVTED